MHPQGRTVEEVVGRIARAQHGVVTRAQLLAAGVTSDEIKGRLRKGALLREYPGVYRVGHRAPSVDARYLAAVLACGEGALLSGPAAGHLLGLLKGNAPPPEVTTPTQRRVKDVKTARARRGGKADATTWHGIPVTTVPRTLVDLSSMLSSPDLARACHEAGIKHGTTPRQVEAVLGRRHNTPGAKRLRRVLHGDVHVTLSALERRFLKRLEEAGLPLPPETNRPAGGRRVDCRWLDHRLTVELDSYRYHRSRHAWEQDRRREREARALGDEFRRYTYEDVYASPRFMLGDLRGLLEGARDRVGA
ncbi:MAG: type IV toxin-antitoxin system AbiEi family antitoxin domain-containing protein [Thermoleophilaceae bacterium]